MEWKSLLEAPLPRLCELTRDVSLPSIKRSYLKAVAGTLQGDRELIERAMKEIEESDDPIKHSAYCVASLRLALISSNAQPKALHRTEITKLEGVFEAEKLFILALNWEKLDRDDKALELFAHAKKSYEEHGLLSKALRSYYNSIVAESRFIPYKNYVTDLQSVILLSQELNETAFEGMARITLSREHQIIGNIDEALKLAREGFSKLSNEAGSYHFHHAQLHLAHLLMEKGEINEAKELIEQSKTSYFEEFQEVARLLGLALKGRLSDQEVKKDSLIFTWKERIADLVKLSQSKGEARFEGASDLELRLLKALWQGPMSKWDLVEALYSDTTDTELLENRLKNLLARVRKKFPDLLQSKGGFYELRA